MPEVRDAPAIRPDNYKFLQENIRKQSGIVLDDTKHYLVEARLLPIALDEGLRNLDDLCAKLRQTAPAPLQRRALAEAKVADAVLPLNEIIPYTVSSCRRSTTRYELRPQETA